MEQGSLWIGNAADRIATGATWSEGPLWLPDAARLRWSDIPGNRILQWDAATGETSVYRSEVEFTNGRALDHDGSVVQCSHGNRRLERETADGTVSSIVDHYGDHRLNSPNDVAIAPDGSYWFTDPDYGIVQPHEGHAGEREYGGCWVFRYSDEQGLVAVVTDMERPNGIAFSPDGSTVYITDTSAALGDGPKREIRAYSLIEGEPFNGHEFASLTEGLPDGIAVDEEGRVWSSGPDGVRVFDPYGTQVDFVPIPEVVGNLCFGGEDHSELFIAASTSIYRVRTATRGAK